MTWPRDEFARAVWEADDLKPLQRLVALAYADHASDSDVAWVTLPRLQQRTGMSRDAAMRARRTLVKLGWLQEKDGARQHQATRYVLRIPRVLSPVTLDQTEGAVSRHSEESQGDARATPEEFRVTAEPPLDGLRVIPDDTRVIGERPDYSADHSKQLSGTSESTLAATPLDHQRVAAEDLARRLGADGVTYADALRAVVAVDEKKRPASLGGYVSRFDADAVLRWSGVQPARRSSARGPRCTTNNVPIPADGSCCDRHEAAYERREQVS